MDLQTLNIDTMFASNFAKTDWRFQNAN